MHKLKGRDRMEWRRRLHDNLTKLGDVISGTLGSLRQQLLEAERGHAHSEAGQQEGGRDQEPVRILFRGNILKSHIILQADGFRLGR